MKELKQLQSEYDYSRVMEGKWGRKANRLEKCIQCVSAKVHKECPSDCAYLER